MTESLRPYIREAQQGNREAVAMLTKQFEPLAKSTAKKYIAAFAVPEEALSLAWYSILYCIHHYDLTKPTPVPYCMKKAIRYFFKRDMYAIKSYNDHITKQVIADGVITDIPVNIEDKTHEGPMEIYLRNEERQEILDTIGKLQPLHQEVITLRYLKNYSIKGIASEMKISKSYVDVLLRQAKGIMKEMLLERHGNKTKD